MSSDEKTFESRLLFLKSVYENKYPNYKILAKCIAHKLKRSEESYIYELECNISYLLTQNSIRVLKESNKGN